MTEVDLTLGWARAFGVTVVVEAAVAVPLLGGGAGSLPRRLGLVTFAQLVSHPVVWFVLPSLVASRSGYLVIAEGWAWLSEACFYALVIPRLGARRALVVALAANGASLAAGLALRALGLPL